MSVARPTPVLYEEFPFVCIGLPDTSNDMVSSSTGSLPADRAVETLQAAIRCASVTGNEAPFARYLAGLLREIGVEPEVGDFLPGRPNVWGLKRGTGGGRRLLLIGHTDVVHARGWRERWAGTEREDPFGAAIVDGEIWGRGAADLKAGICTAVEALRNLDASGEPWPATSSWHSWATRKAANPGWE
jgi:acetylornithine deacetylase